MYTLDISARAEPASWQKAAFKMSDFIASAQEAHIQLEIIP
jgi:hypothetical protein